MKHDNTSADGIRANLKALHTMLGSATRLAEEASGHMERQQQNMAIGTIVGAEDMLEQASALYKAIIALHRCKAPEAV